MKVLHLTSGNLFGGIEVLLLTYARCRNLCPAMEPQFGLCFSGRLRDELTALGVPIHDLGAVRLSRPWTVLRARSRLKRVLREQKIDAVVTHGMWPHAVFAPAVRRAGIRLVNAVHDFLDRKSWINRWAARTPPDVVIANSRYTAPSAEVLFNGAPVEVIYYPITPSIVDRDSARRELRMEMGTPPESVVILQASRLERWKGQHIHIEALGHLADVPGWEAWFAGGVQKAGEADYLSELQASAQRLGIADRVKFLGQRADVPKLLAAADIFCQPNAGPEPFGIVFIEALNAGLAVVSSAFGGAAEIVTDTCGILCPPGNACAVSDAIRGLIGDPIRRQTLGNEGPVRGKEICDPARQLSVVTSALTETTL